MVKNKELQVTKRSGQTEPFSLRKIHRVLAWACEGLTGVSISEIELKANVQLYDSMNTHDIHELLIKSSASINGRVINMFIFCYIFFLLSLTVFVLQSCQ